MDDLELTPLYETHVELGARMVPYAGYSMPLQYPMGVMDEHLHSRVKAGLFDVSHMGQVAIDGPSWEAIATGFEQLVPQDVLGLGEGRQRYGFFTNDAGGIIDDLMFARHKDRLIVVVNAACKAGDIAHMKAALEPELTVTSLSDNALIALQGPKAERVLADLDARCKQMRFMDMAVLDLNECEVLATRSGYTGNDGFELSVPDQLAATIWNLLCDAEDVAPIGLAARNSLRMEAGLCLYGNDIDVDTTPVEAGLTWAIQKVRRNGGARSGGFLGAARILSDLDNGPDRCRVGLLPLSRAPMREGVALFDAETGGTAVGAVTSGGFGPSVNTPVAMGYVAADFSFQETQLWGEVRGKRLPVKVVKLPFTSPTFKR